MTAFHERNFASRWGQMGDKAETAFTTLHPKAHRTGLDRTTLNVREMSDLQRYTPDFMLENGMYEVMGFASRGNNVLKLKCEKLSALQVWHRLIPTYLWVRDSSRDVTWCAPADAWATACYQAADRHHFPDNNRAYWQIAPEHFPTTPMVVAA